MNYKIYILKEDYNTTDFFEYKNIDLFTNKNDRHYVQYKKKWEDKYTTKYWTLEELVWEYEYWEGTMKVELITRVIDI